MRQVGKFEKVSLEQYRAAMRDVFEEHGCTGVDESNMDEVIQGYYNEIQLPTRATKGSAGYDFKSPIGFVLPEGKSIKIPTGIRCLIDEGWWLGCFPRSGLGFKYQMQLANTCGVIDSDYANSDNEGHIFFKFVNRGDKKIDIDAGDGIAQGIFVPYGITYDDDADEERNGGFGSTGK